MSLDIIFLEIRLFLNSLLLVFSEILPRVFFAVLILILGFFIGKSVGKFTQQLMKRLGIENALKRTEAEKISERVGFKILKSVEIFISWIVYIVSIFLAFEVLELPGFRNPMDIFINYIPNILIAFFIVIVGLVVADKIAIFVEKLFEEINIPKYWFFGKGVRYFIYILVGTMALTQLKVSTGILVITITTIMVFWFILVAIGLKNIVPNFFSGVFIVFYSPVNVGDTIKIEEIEGVVEEVSLIYTKIKREDGKYVLVPNSRILDNVIVKD